jgi:UDP-glucuronate 4-epimerase
MLTGVAGFIGFHLAERLMRDNAIENIIAIDNLNEYYDVQLKKNRINKLKKNKNSDKLLISRIIKKFFF